MVIITHKLHEALSVADDVTVLRRGRTVLAAARSDVDSELLARAMMGTGETVTVKALAGATAAGSATEHTAGAAVIDARDLMVTDERGVLRVKGVTMRVHAGEIVGVVGVEGAGQRELLRALSGRMGAAGGILQIPERIGFIPEDRHRDALILDFTLQENVALAGAGRAHGRMCWPEIEQRTDELLAHYDIVASGPRERVSALSGGNQQKLVLAREIHGEPEALVAENPTRGLDIAATAALHQRLAEVRDSGMAVLLYSSDLDEVLAMADRLFVMFEGRAREVPLDRAEAGRAMLGAV